MIDRVTAIASFCLAACTVPSESSLATPDEVPSRPNVILVMADDLGWGDTGYNGHPVLQTPHLDALSREGLRFDRFYAGSSVCSPTRGSCLTGRHPYRYGVTTANRGHLREDEVSLAEVLGDAGYATGHFGKWHLGTLSPDYSGKGPGRRPEENYCTPGMAGFDTWFSTEFAVATWDPYAPENSHTGKRPYDTRALYWENGRNVQGPLAGCDSKLIVDRALPFFEDAVDAGRPFFAVVWFHAPHEPVVGGPEYRALYPDATPDEQHYYAVVTALDEQVGRLRTKLAELGVERDTMLWFCSDNGPEGNPGPVRRRRGSAGPYRGRKRSLYEGGVRVPGLVTWPARFGAPRAIAAPCVTSDYFPTILAAAGIEHTSDGRAYDGVDLMPLLDGEREGRPRPIGFEFGKQATLVGERFKLVHNTAKKRPRSDNGTVPFAEFELYDVIADPGETEDVAARHPDVVETMRAELARWQASR
ncbi:MAG: sulfatase-like hydrolase/transferase [bacterium]|nr:sulfatase-like hydrolase/transferase [bacterium]